MNGQRAPSDAAPGPDGGRRYPQRPIVGVGAVIVVDEAVVLVRRRNEPLAGKWSLPGGGVELGETLEQAVRREVLEETGLVVDVGAMVDVVERIHHDSAGAIVYHYVLVDYLCGATAGDLRAGTDAADVTLASEADLEGHGVAASTRRIIAKGLEMASRARGDRS